MELLLKRNETTNAIGLTRYDLFAKLELTPEEEARMRKTEAKKTFVWQPDDETAMREGRSSRLKGAGLAILLGFIAVPILGSPLWFWVVALISWIPLSKWIFNQTRQGITVADVITGRTIRCKSMDELLVKENDIREKTKSYCNNLEALHSLGDVQRITFKPE